MDPNDPRWQKFVEFIRKQYKIVFSMDGISIAMVYPAGSNIPYFEVNDLHSNLRRGFSPNIFKFQDFIHRHWQWIKDSEFKEFIMAAILGSASNV